MTITEILQGKGISADVIKAILEDMKTNRIFTASEENLDVRYGKLKTDHEGKTKELDEANKLIEEMKKSTKGQEELQGKITAYEQQVEALQKELLVAKVDSAVKVGLLTAKAADVDYLTYKLREKLKADGEDLKLDDNGAIKGWEEKLNGLKTQFPAMFESSSAGDDGLQVLDPNRLKENGGGETVTTKEAFKAMTYEQRVALKQKNEQLYKQLAK